MKNSSKTGANTLWHLFFSLFFSFFVISTWHTWFLEHCLSSFLFLCLNCEARVYALSRVGEWVFVLFCFCFCFCFVFVHLFLICLFGNNPRKSDEHDVCTKFFALGSEDVWPHNRLCCSRHLSVGVANLRRQNWTGSVCWVRDAMCNLLIFNVFCSFPFSSF